MIKCVKLPLDNLIGLNYNAVKPSISFFDWLFCSWRTFFIVADLILAEHVIGGNQA
jgi:hypothetical protein